MKKENKKNKFSHVDFDVCMRDTRVIHELPLRCTFLNCAAKPMCKTLEARFASPFSGCDVTRSTPKACFLSSACLCSLPMHLRVSMGKKQAPPPQLERTAVVERAGVKLREDATNQTHSYFLLVSQRFMF